MLKKLLAALVLFGSLCAAQTINGNREILGELKLSGQFRPVQGTFAARPAAAGGNAGHIYVVTDAAEAGSCSAGGGTARSLCRSTGSVWESLGDGGTGSVGGGISGGTLGQPIVATGATTIASVPLFVDAGQLAGANCGAKINAADTALGAAYGEIWVDPACGATWTTAVSLSAKHILRVKPGAYTALSITLNGDDSGIVCDGAIRSCRITESTTNTHLVTVAGSNTMVRGMYLEQTGSGTGDVVHASGSYSQVRIADNELVNGYHDIWYALGATSANSLWITGNKINGGGRADSAVSVLNLGAASVGAVLSGVHIDGNTFSGTTSHSSQVYSPNYLGIARVVYSNNIVLDSGGAGLWGAYVDGIVFSGNVVSNVIMEGLDIEGGQHINITGNTIKTVTDKAISVLSFAGGVTSTTSATAVSANTIAAVTPASMTNIKPLAQLYVDSAGTPETVTVTGVTATTFTALFRSAHSGTWNIVGAGPSNDSRVISNDVTISSNAIADAGTSAAIYVADGTNVVITGNSIRNTTTNGIFVATTGAAGSHMFLTNFTVTGNSVRSDRLISSTTGIRLDGGGVDQQMQQFTVTGNTVDRFPVGIAVYAAQYGSVLGNVLRNNTLDYDTDAYSVGSVSIVAPSATGLTVADDPYNSTTWNGSRELPTKNSLRDYLETLGTPAGDNLGTATADDVVDLFTGTPDGTKFLRDDGTLVTPSGSGDITSVGTCTTGACTLVDADIPPDITLTNFNQITTRSASDLSSGTLPDARFPATLPVLSGLNLTALNASNLGSGTVPDARFPATIPAASGANLTALNGSNVASGTVADARIDAAIARLASPAFSGNPTVPTSGAGDSDTSASSTAFVDAAVIARVTTHATDCTALTTGRSGDICTELDSERFFTCQPTAGTCDTAGEWILTPGAAGGAGTVTDFSAGNAGTLFTTTEATTTTTPALSFALTNAAQQAFWAGPATGGTGAPAYRAIVAADVPTLNQSTTGDAGTLDGINSTAFEQLANKNGAGGYAGLDGSSKLTAAQVTEVMASTGLSDIASKPFSGTALLSGTMTSPAAGDSLCLGAGATDIVNCVQGSPVNAQTGTTYTVLTGDRAKLVTFTNAGAIAVTLPQAGATFPDGWVTDFQNRGVGTLTITPTTSTIDGAASLTLATDQGVRVFSNGTDYFTQRGRATGGGSGTVTSFSAGDLSPLFTTSEATSTTTPALTFGLTNASQNAVFAGPASGGTGAPTYRALVDLDIPLVLTDKTSLNNVFFPDANTIEIRNSTTAQVLRVYGTYTNASNYERFEISTGANDTNVQAVAAGTGAQQHVWFDGSNLSFKSAGTLRWRVDGSGHFMSGTDNSFDIGAAAATRPRNGYFGTSVVAPTINASTTLQVGGANINTIYAPLASPTLTGVPAAPTASALTNTTQLATTAFVDAAVLARVLTHATDCTAVTTGRSGDICTELDSERLFTCQPTAGTCDTAGEWVLSGDGAGSGAPTGATYITQTADAGLSAEQALGALATGILKSTTTTGVLSIAVAGDFPTLNQSTTGDAGTLDGINSTSFEQIANKNAASGYAGLDGSSKLTAAQMTEQMASTGLSDFASKFGTGTAILGSTITSATAGDVLCLNSSADNVVNCAPGIPANPQTGTSYTVLTGDRGKLVTHSNASATAVTLPQATGTFPAAWTYSTLNMGAGTVTITPTTSTFQNAETTLVLTTGQWAQITSNGTDYRYLRGGATSGSGTVTSFSAADLSPLFTTSEATATTTPALTFTLSTAAANTVFGNNTGSTAAPGFQSLVDAQIPTTLAGKTLTTPTIASFTNATHNHTNAAGGGTLTLAGAAFVNQGTTTTVLHGNAAGNPSFAAVSLTADVSGILPGANGGSGNGFFAISGPTTSLKTFTLPNATATILTDNAAVTVAQGGTGAATLTGLLQGNGTSAFTNIQSSTVGQVLRVTGANTSAFGALDLADTDAVTGVLPVGNLPAASTTAAGIIESAIASEVNTGSSTTLAVTPSALRTSAIGTKYITVDIIEQSTAVTTGDKKVLWMVPSALVGWKVVSVELSIGNAASSSGIPTARITRCVAVATTPCSGTTVSMLSTLVTIDASEDRSDTAAAAVAIDAANNDLPTGGHLRFDVTVAGTGTQGLQMVVGLQAP